MSEENHSKPRLSCLVKWPDFAGYGFNLHAERGKAGQYIGKVDDGSPAEAAGLKQGDRIVEINGVNIGNENHQQVVSRIKAGGDEVKMLVLDNEAEQYYKEQKTVVRNDMPDVVMIQCPHRHAQQDEQTDIEARADEVPPAESYPVNSVDYGDEDSEHARAEFEVAEILQDAVMNERERSRTPSPEPYRERTPSPPRERTPSPEPERERTPSPPRERTPTPEPPRERTPTPEPEIVPAPLSDVSRPTYIHPRLCHISKVPDFQGYGFNLHAEKEKTGQYIGKIDDDSPAEKAGLREADRIVEVNGVNIESSAHAEVIQVIKAGGDETRMLVVDPDADKWYQENSITISGDLPEVECFANIKEEQQEAVTAAAVEITPTIPTTLSRPESIHPRQCHLRKWPDFQGYGFNLHAEKNKIGQFVDKIDDASPAQTAGLRERDRIVEVNNINVEDDTHHEVINKIKAGGDEVKLLVVDPEADTWYQENGEKVSNSLPEVVYIATPLRGAVNGTVEPVRAPEPAQSVPVSQPEPQRMKETAPPPPVTSDAQANGDPLSMNLSAKEMRERLSSKRRKDPRQQKMDFKSKWETFQKL